MHHAVHLTLSTTLLTSTTPAIVSWRIVDRDRPVADWLMRVDVGVEDQDNAAWQATVKNSFIKPETRTQYRRSGKKFLLWLVTVTEFSAAAPDILTPALKRRLATVTDGDPKKIEAIVKDFSHGLASSVDGQGVTHPDVNCPPIFFNKLVPQHYLNWLASLRKVSGARPRKDQMLAHRSGIMNLYRDYQVPMSPELAAGLETIMKGVKKKDASDRAAGVCPRLT